MTFTFKLDLGMDKVNQNAKVNLVQKLLPGLMKRHTNRHKHSRQIALSGPLTWSVNSRHSTMNSRMVYTGYLIYV